MSSRDAEEKDISPVIFPEIGVCCFCGEGCNPCSQCCGRCIRNSGRLLGILRSGDKKGAKRGAKKMRSMIRKLERILDKNEELEDNKFLEKGIKHLKLAKLNLNKSIK